MKTAIKKRVCHFKARIQLIENSHSQFNIKAITVIVFLPISLLVVLVHRV